MMTDKFVFGNYEYELFGEDYQDIDLREKLAKLYSSPFCDILWEEALDPSLENNRCYKLYAYEQSVLKHILYFSYSAELPKKISILNFMFTMEIEHIKHVCDILFHKFKKVKQILFREMFDAQPHFFSKPIIWKDYSNDVIIHDLPNTIDAYLKSLGHNTRKHIKLCLNRIAKNFPDFKVHFFEKNDISYEQIRKVIELNTARMIYKGIKPYEIIDPNRFYKYASSSGNGLLCLCTNNDEVIAGTINWIVGEQAYMHTISHNNSYNRYSLGQIVLFDTIKYLIEEKHIHDYHLLSGEEGYKFHFGGINHDCFHIEVFRNKNIFMYYEKIKMELYIKNLMKLKTRLKKNKFIFDLVKKTKNKYHIEYDVK